MGNQKLELGWTLGGNAMSQVIRQECEREDLIAYIWDTHKSLHGFRPRGLSLQDWTTEQLRTFADDMADDLCRERDAEQARYEQELEHKAKVAEARQNPRAVVWKDENGDEHYYINPRPASQNLTEAMKIAFCVN